MSICATTAEDAPVDGERVSPVLGRHLSKEWVEVGAEDAPGATYFLRLYAAEEGSEELARPVEGPVQTDYYPMPKNTLYRRLITGVRAADTGFKVSPGIA